MFVIGEPGFKREIENHGVKVANPHEEDYLSPDDFITINDF